MTKKDLRELIRATIREYTGTGASGGNSFAGGKGVVIIRYKFQ